MTSGLPPDAPERRRAGGFVPVAVPSTGWLPFFVVLLGTVLLSVVLGCRRRHVPRWAVSLAVSLRPSAGHGRPPPRRNAGWRPLVGAPSPGETWDRAGCSHIGRVVVLLGEVTPFASRPPRRPARRAWAGSGRSTASAGCPDRRAARWPRTPAAKGRARRGARTRRDPGGRRRRRPRAPPVPPRSPLPRGCPAGRPRRPPAARRRPPPR